MTKFHRISISKYIHLGVIFESKEFAQKHWNLPFTEMSLAGTVKLPINPATSIASVMVNREVGAKSLVVASPQRTQSIAMPFGHASLRCVVALIGKNNVTAGPPTRFSARASLRHRFPPGSLHRFLVDVKYLRPVFSFLIWTSRSDLLNCTRPSRSRGAAPLVRGSGKFPSNNNRVAGTARTPSHTESRVTLTRAEC